MSNPSHLPAAQAAAISSCAFAFGGGHKLGGQFGGESMKFFIGAFAGFGD